MFSINKDKSGCLHSYIKFKSADSTFQTGSTIDEELTSLKICLKIHKVDNVHLQVPFPPLNKTLPPHQQQPVQHLEPLASSSEVAAVERAKTSEVETSASPKNTVKEEAISSSSTREGVNVRDNPSLKSSPSIDWSTLAKQLIAVLEKAIYARVVRAPNLPSSTQEASVASSANFGNSWKSEPESIFGMESRHGQPMEQPVCREELVGDLNIIHGRARIAILFSGGVDSMLLAALTDR